MRSNTTCFALVVALGLFISAPAHADLLAWYRMGDDDSGLTTPPADGNPWDDDDGSLNNPLGTWGSEELNPPSAADPPYYSSVVPGALIYDPVTDTNYANAWSMQTFGDSNETGQFPGNEQYGQTSSLTLPPQFTHEVFFRYDNIDNSNLMTIADQYGNTGGGWFLELRNDATVRLEMAGYNEPESANLVLNSVTSLTPGVWHHVALVFDGNSQDGSDDVHLYIDYQLDVSGNLPDDQNYSVSTVRYHAGSYQNAPNSGRLDEARYFDEVLDPSQFLHIVPEPATAILLMLGSISWWTAGCRRARKFEKPTAKSATYTKQR